MHVSLATTLTIRGAKKGDPVRSEGSRSIRGKKKEKKRKRNRRGKVSAKINTRSVCRGT